MTAATIKLKYPVEHAGMTYSELSMRQSKVRDRIAAQKVKGDEIEKEIFLFACLCEVPQEVFQEMTEVDYFAVQKVYLDFLTKNDSTD